jgi:hypothetical protein
MKPTIKVLVLSLTLFICAMLFPKQAEAQHAHVSFQLFYDQLSPYGEWVNYPNHGYVWIPDVGSDFSPYKTDGHWVLTKYGWTWASNYRWGWAPFHYGRWSYDRAYGWFWAPGTDWGPAWVTWRRSNGYYGWEPMRPGFSISLSFGRPYNSNDDHWTYVRCRDIDRPDIDRYSVGQTYHPWLFRNSTVINKTYIDNSRNTTYIYGPERSEVQKATGRTFTPVTIRENSRPGQTLSKGQLQIYRPEVSNNKMNERRITPSRVTELKDVKHPSERNMNNKPRNENPSQNNQRDQQPTRINQQDRNSNPRPAQQQQQQNARSSQQQDQKNARSAQQQPQQQQQRPVQQQQQALPQKQQQQQRPPQKQQENSDKKDKKER